MKLRLDIEERYKQAIKEKKDQEIGTLRLIKSAIKNKNYKESLDLYKDIKWHLNIFFNKVLVNVDQSNIKANRLNILSLVREIFSEYADFSIIDLGNENK